MLEHMRGAKEGSGLRMDQGRNVRIGVSMQLKTATKAMYGVKYYDDLQ